MKFQFYWNGKWWCEAWYKNVRANIGGPKTCMQLLEDKIDGLDRYDWMD